MGFRETNRGCPPLRDWVLCCLLVGPSGWDLSQASPSNRDISLLSSDLWIYVFGVSQYEK